MLYELRKYEVMPGKVPALLDRFATFTTRKWKEYGVRLVGFWAPDVGGHNHQVIYILGWESLEERTKNFGAWQASPERAAKWAETEKDGPLVRRVNNLLMQPTDFSQLDKGIPYGPDASGRQPYLFELREYDANPGKLPNLVKRFGGFTIDSFKQHGMRQVGYWTPFMGGHNHQLVYILAWESYDERTKRFAEFRADPERQRVFAESEKDGVLVERVNNLMMAATPFSPMR
jgi:hypothetical protein